MKKTIAIIMIVVLSLTAVVGGTYAYFTDTDMDVNTMVVGDVKIVQNETDRDNNAYTDGLNLVPAVYNGELAYDGTVDFPNGTELKIWDQSVKNEVDKFISVTNTGSNDAYIRTIVLMENTADNAICAKIHGLWSNSDGQYRVWVTNDTGAEEMVEIDDVLYSIAVCTYKTALQPGETSDPSLMQLFLDPSATNEWSELVGDEFTVLALSQAAQADGFEDAATALDAAFGEVNAENVAAWFAAAPTKTTGAANVVPIVAVDTVEELTNALNQGMSVILTGTLDAETNDETLTGYPAEYMWTTGGSLTGGTLDMNNGGVYGGLSIINENDFHNTTAAVANVSDTAITGSAGYSIYAQAIHADVNLNNMTISNTWGGGILADFGPSTVYVNDCTVTAADGSSSAAAYQQSALQVAGGANMVVNGGTYTGAYAVYVYSTGGTITINGGTFVGGLKVDAGEIVINGGTFSVDPSTVNGVTVNGTVVDNGNGTWTVK